MDKDETIDAAEKLVAGGTKDALILWKETLPTAAKNPGQIKHKLVSEIVKMQRAAKLDVAVPALIWHHACTTPSSASAHFQSYIASYNYSHINM